MYPNLIMCVLAPDTIAPITAVKPKDSTTLIVEFTEAPGATHYIIRTENNYGFFREEQVNSSPAEIGSLTPYTDYTISILAANGVSRSQPSTPMEAKTVLPPVHLTASSPSNDSIIVSWDPVDNAVLYSVSLYKINSTNKITLNTTDTTLTVTDLDAGSLYIISGYAWDVEGRQGERSIYINQRTRKEGQGLLYAPGTIQYLVMSDGNLQCNTTSKNCTISPVACGETRTIQVTAVNEAGPGHPSSPLVFTAENCTLTWNLVPHADNYTAYIKMDDGIEETCNTTGNSCNFHCQCGYTYQLSVFAYNEAGRSPPGEIFNHTTLPCCPEDVSISLVSTETLEIMWAAARGAELYETRAADNSEVILCNDTAPVCALSDLTCDSSYTVVVTPCNDIRGCNRACQPHTRDTAPCAPVDLMVTQKNESCVTVSWTASNRAATYTVSAVGGDGRRTCTTDTNSCDIADLPCGSTYEVVVIAANNVSQSLPSFSVPLETAPCCPVSLTVDQVTQAMSNVTWSDARGAESYITSLTSSRGHARCHTRDSHCLMGCITCGTNYTVTMEAFSRTGHKSNCTYQGFSSSACCPSGVRLYRMANNSLRVYWRLSSNIHTYTVELVGSNANYTCSPLPGENSCDVSDVLCGDVYHVVVAPLTQEGHMVQFCPQRVYSVLYRGKRSVD
uniref:Fibronectin type III domain containing 7 n=1 Tax=Myripristis murdjan TaxID=586833 RepID=A0A667XFH5_9TELE